ncbi:MAG: tetratricopeptide repeat protein [Candidatus Obscuribacterales bacterium]|nr:tetratricopeptide repeat protein [Candidatus Obscuribacterales bacterium]
MSDCTNESCCSSDPSQQNRRFAKTLVDQANRFLDQEGRPVAEALLNASRAMLFASGGVNGEEGVWLSTTEGHLPYLDESFREALWHFEEALRIACEDLDQEHFAVGVCYYNVADTNLKLGYVDEAMPEFEKARAIIARSLESETDKQMIAYLDSVLKEIESGSASALAMLESEV